GGVISIFTGGGLASKIFADDLIENYRKNYTEETVEALDKHIREQRLEQTIDDQITTAFKVLKEKLEQEVNALLDNTQKIITELSDKRGRQEAMTEAERQEFNQIRAETQRILGNAQRLCEQLTEIISV
ncbi:MAG: dynamin family protein, partial [Cuspidothrix sp.]